MEQTATPILDKLYTPEDFRRLPDSELVPLAEELRGEILDTVSHNGGHLASSLGAVEIILALHRVFETPKDKIVFDVGHQAYAHKILTGRRGEFCTLRRKDGISGFPKREESEHDAFNTGHATTSISAALGMARAMRLKGEDGTAVAVIGDGALAGGMAFEALNDAGEAKVPLVIVLNDNDMSIAKNVGQLHRQLQNMRVSSWYVRLKRRIVRMLDSGVVGRFMTDKMFELKGRIKNMLLPHMLFEEMGFLYLGPIDGHDIEKLTYMFRRAKELRLPVIVHCITKKGRGYAYSEEDPVKFHGISAFCADTGLVDKVVNKTNSAVFCDMLLNLAARDERICAITAAMPDGTGLTQFREQYPNRFFDVGICEEHAVTMAAGMATQGMRPVVAIYSTFLQRAFDQVLHDVCLMNLPVVLCVDRAGLVGDDGETHQGVFDLAYLTILPNMTVYSPATQQELVRMLSDAIRRGKPAAIRYSRGSLMQMVSEVPIAPGKWELLRPLSDCVVIATGTAVQTAWRATEKTGVGLINARTLKPLDTAMLAEVARTAKRVIVMEEGVDCLGRLVAEELSGSAIPIERICVPDEPIRQASIAEQREYCGLTEEHLREVIGESGRNSI